jgi:hypothetical protein
MVEDGDVSMWLEFTIPLEETKQNCSFANDILLSVTEFISRYFPDRERPDMNAWI